MLSLEHIDALLRGWLPYWQAQLRGWSPETILIWSATALAFLRTAWSLR